MIESNRRATNDEWDTMVDASQTALYFQTREWFEIWSEYADFEIDTRLITFNSGKRVLLPLTRTRLLGGLLPVSLLAPKGMGGFIASDDLSAEEKGALFGYLRKLRLFYGAANPFDALTNQFAGFNAHDVTQVLDLRPGFDAIFKTWTDGHRKRAKKGSREGVAVDLAADENDWRSYFALYEGALARWGDKATNRYGWELFQLMFKRQSGSIKLWLAKYQGKPICGALNFYHNKHVAAWHGASSREMSRKLNANHVLEYCMIKDACERGFWYYDFLPSSGIPGVVEFKGGFSPQSIPVHIYMSPLMRTSSVLRQAVRHTPAYRLVMKGTGF